MQIKTKAIVLSALKYQEKSLIVKCFTEEAGMVSFFVRNAFAKGKSAQKIAYFQPLTILDIDFVYKNKGGLEYYKDRKRLLTMIISYYEQHLNDFRKPNSLEVLKEVFSN